MHPAPNTSKFTRAWRPALLATLCLVAMAATAPLAQARKISITHSTSLGPATASNPTGANHTVTATVKSTSQNCDPDFPGSQTWPAANVSVKFEVTSGPNQGLTGGDTTDAQGHANFTYTSSTPGTDTLVATPVGLKNIGLCNDDPGTPAGPSNKVEAIWLLARDGGEDDGGPNIDDGHPQLSIDDVRVIEGDDDLSPATPATFTVSLSKPSSVPITVEYGTADGSATDAWDYVAQHDKLTFAPGDPLTKKVTIDVRGDEGDEPDEWFTVNLSNATNAQIADATGIGTIEDDDDGLVAP